jgi:hypothetical protein
VAVAAWGSFLTGGAFAPQPRLARAALATTFLAGLLTLGVTAKLLIGAWFVPDTKHDYTLDRTGRVLVVHREYGLIKSVTDLQGRPVQQLKGNRLDNHALREVEALTSPTVWAQIHSYRNPGRYFVRIRNESTPERWYFVCDRGWLLGYDATSKRLIGRIGPDGFAPPQRQPQERFRGEPYYATFLYEAGPAAYLDLPGGMHRVDFAQRTLQALFTPEKGEAVLGAVRWWDEQRKAARAVVLTRKTIHVVDEAGAPLFSAPLVFDREDYGVVRVARLEGPPRFAVWYEPSACPWTEAAKTTPGHLVEYDDAGRERARRALPPRPLSNPSYVQALFGLVTPPAEAAGLAGATEEAASGVRCNRGQEIPPLLFFVAFMARFFVPGADWDAAPARGPLLAFGTLVLLSALACALICFLLARCHAFARTHLVGWALVGLLFGPAGLLLMLAVQDWPARVACPACRKPRVVTRDACERCGAAHAPPAPDGTEVFELPAASPQPALAGR